ncbi:hypothetical protein DL93DRAFT_135913 [Clavulina sp. PMI_390]|nr:hypothetical protein DL93DRAFT_135913 [Clavulina sp. PMI_390]
MDEVATTFVKGLYQMLDSFEDRERASEYYDFPAMLVWNDRPYILQHEIMGFFKILPWLRHEIETVKAYMDESLTRFEGQRNTFFVLDGR